jgi:apolipoprotein N-acyltransferase
MLDVRRLRLGLLAVLITALLIFFGTGLQPFWPLMWFAPLPVLMFAADASRWGAAVTAALGIMLGLGNLWGLFHGPLRIPWFIVVQIYLSEGVVYALAALLHRALLRRKAYWSALLAMPALLVSFEWFLNLTSSDGTGGSLAYSQLGFLPFLQLASIAGPWGMSFLLLLFPSAIAIGLHLRERAPKQALRIVGLTAGLLTAVLVFGAVRLAIPPDGRQVKVGLVSSDGPNEDVADEGAPTATLFQGYGKPVAALAARGAELVVLPEKLGVAVDPATKAVDAQLQSLAEQTHVRVVAGMIRVVPPSGNSLTKIKYNEARVYTPGTPVESYDKEHMLPPFESALTPGTTLTLLAASGGNATWGVAICKDMDFTGLGRRYGEAGAGLMLVPGWDFFQDWIEHGHMAIMRGVESGFSVARSAKGGSLFVSDDRGRILAEVKSDAAPFSTLLATVPQSHDKTLFLILGDWFAWVALAVLTLTLVQLVRLRKRWSPVPVVRGMDWTGSSADRSINRRSPPATPARSPRASPEAGRPR